MQVLITSQRERMVYMENKMFCFQCQETAGCKGCTQVGVCGKKPEVAGLQDLLIYVTKGISAVSTALREAGKTVSQRSEERFSRNAETDL